MRTESQEMNLTGKTALVTGATGFLGGTLARRLANDGVHVRVLARSPERAASLRALSNVEIVPGDLTQPDTLIEAVKGCDVVFHVAVSYADRMAQRAVNVDGTRNLARTASAANVSRFVHVSSIAVYGYRHDADVTEATPLKAVPDDPYNNTKLEAERVLRETGEKSGLPYSIIRPGMIYGAGSQPWTKNIFRLARRSPILFPGDGSGTVYPIHVDDVVDLSVRLATHPAAVGEAFNCAPDPAPTWREWLTAYARLVGHDRWLAIPFPLVNTAVKLLARVAPHDSALRTLPDYAHMLTSKVTFRMDKARDRLGWQPQVDLQTGVAGCAPWLREQGLLR